MYKKRLANWGARKNYTREQKRAAISKLVHEGADIDSTLLLQINGQPLKTERLWRPVQYHGREIPLTPRPGRGNRRVREFLANLAERDPTFVNASVTPYPIQLADCAADQDTRIVLHCADTFYTSHREQPQAPTTYRYTAELRAVFDQLEAARMFLSIDINVAFAMMNRIWAGGVELFRSHPFHLLHCLVAGLGNDWTKFEHIRLELLSFFASVAKQTLGITHPITRVTTLLHASGKAERVRM